MALIIPILSIGFSWNREATLRLRQSGKVQNRLAKKTQIFGTTDSECFDIKALNYFSTRRILVISKVEQLPRWDLLVPAKTAAPFRSCIKIE